MEYFSRLSHFSEVDMVASMLPPTNCNTFCHINLFPACFLMQKCNPVSGHKVFNTVYCSIDFASS